MISRLAQTHWAALALLLLLAAPAGGGTGVGVSGSGTLDTRVPSIALGQPVEGEPLLIGEEYEFLWSVAEEHFAAEGAVMTLEILAGGETLHSAQFGANEGGEYGHLWSVQADSSMAATWRVGAADLFGNAASVESGPFLISDGETGLPAAPPERITLARNFPNPFNPVTTIRFALPVAGEVRLAIHDVRGRRVALLLQDHMEAGWRSLNWNAGEQASGVYFARLEAGGETLTRKMVLLR